MPTPTPCHLRLAATAASLLLAAVLATTPAARAQGGPTSGPDVTVIYISGTSNLGAVNGIRAYSIGTTSCNIGDKDVNWCDEPGGCSGGSVSLTNAQHPVIAQNLYRLKDGRFLQLGMSWLKHGFVSTNSTDSTCKVGHPTCSGTPVGGHQLGIGCTDTYGSGLNSGGGSTCAGGSGCRLGQRSEVNPTTGVYPMPYTNVSHPQSIDQRIQVPEVDINPALNAGATYWIEGQYISDNDAQAGNGLNNASYRLVTVGASPFNMTTTSTTVREKTALYAWKAADPAVEIFNADFCSAPLERFEVARKVTVVDVDTWHYEYVVRNLNSDHAAQRFSVDFADGTPIANVGFYDVDSHSGEPYSTTDWTPAVNTPTGTVSWETETWANNNNANALRWATMYTFWFDADADPATAQHVVVPFKPLVIAEAGPGATICAGEIAHLGTPAIAGHTYLWSPGGATTAQINVSPATPTVYTLTATTSCANAQDTVTVTVEPLLSAPSLISPASGSTGLQPPVALSWGAVAGATDYTVELATDAGFTNVVDTVTVAATAAQVSSLGAQTYFWRVVANGTCESVPSAAFNFTVASEVFRGDFEVGGIGAWSLSIP